MLRILNQSFVVWLQWDIECMIDWQRSKKSHMDDQIQCRDYWSIINHNMSLCLTPNLSTHTMLKKSSNAPLIIATPGWVIIIEGKATIVRTLRRMNQKNWNKSQNLNWRTGMWYMRYTSTMPPKNSWIANDDHARLIISGCRIALTTERDPRPVVRRHSALVPLEVPFYTNSHYLFWVYRVQCATNASLAGYWDSVRKDGVKQIRS